MNTVRLIVLLLIIIVLIVIFNYRKSKPQSKFLTGGNPDPTLILLEQESETEQDKLTRLLENQQQMLKIALGLNGRVQAPRKATAVRRTRTKGEYKDWAHRGVATQSSNYGNYLAKNVIDGDLSTFNHTDMSPNANSWLKIKLPFAVEINKIVIENRQDTPGSLVFRKRLPPFKVTVTNASGIEVASKTFNDILQTYVWNDVYTVGADVTVTQLKKNYLHMAEIKIFGVPAQPCEYYEQIVAQNREKVSPIFQQFKASACQLPQPSLAQKEIVKAQAAKFNQILKKASKLQEAKTQQAKKAWDNILSQQRLERQMAAQARRLGLPPPKPTYTKSQVSLVQKNLKVNKLTLTDEQKAECMDMYNKIQEMKDKGVSASSTDPSVMSSMATQLIDLQQKYDQQCVPPDNRVDLASTSLLEPTASPVNEKEPLNS
jgi:hypothetical protein